MNIHDRTERDTRYAFILIFALMAAGIVLIGYLYYLTYERNLRAEIGLDLSSVAESRVSELTLWRKERLGDGAVLFKNITFSRLARRFLEQPGDTDAQQQLYAWMDKYHTAYQYARVFLFDTKGTMRMSAPQTQEPIDLSVARNVAAIHRAGRVILNDFHRDTPDGPIHMDVVVPIFDESDNSRPLGVLALNIDPATYLYPFLGRWPTPRQTAETLLVRRDGDDALFLSELRFRKNAPLNLRIPLTHTEVPAVRAALGQIGSMDGVDYRGEPQVAVALAVPGSPWYLITRMNTSEAYEPMRERLKQMTAFVGILLFSSGVAINFLWRQRSKRYRERDKVEAKLRQSEERLWGILDNTSAVVYLKDIEGRFILVNRRFEELFHLQRGQTAGKTDHHLFPKAMADAFRANDLRVINAGAPIEMEEVAPLDDGLHTYISVKFPIKDEHGCINAVAGISTDITLLRQEEKELRRVKDSLAKAQSVSKLGNWELDIVTKDGWWSDETFRLVGMEPGGQAPSFEEFLQRVHPDDRELMIKAMNAALQEGKPCELDFRVALPDMARRILHVQADILRDETGKPVKMLGVTQDVTARRDAEKELRDSRERMNRIVETVTEGIYIVNAEGRIEFVNAAAEKIFGLPRSELYQRAFNDPGWTLTNLNGSAFGPDDYPFAKVRNTLKPVRNIEFIVSQHDGFKIIVSVNAAPIFDQNGVFTGMVATQRDITDEKGAEESLNKALAENEQLIQSLPSILIWVNDEDTVVRWNAGAEAAFGIKASDALCVQFTDLKISWDWAKALEYVSTCRDNGKILRANDVPYVRASGKDGFLGVTFSPVFDDGGEWRGFLLLAADVTERKVMESQLVQAQKLESIGQLAAGIAHEINTPIQYVGDNLRFLKDSFEDMGRLLSEYAKLKDAVTEGGGAKGMTDGIAAMEEEVDLHYLCEEIPKAVTQSLGGVERVAKIVRAMKEFSHPGVEEKTAMDINKAIESTIMVCKHEWKYVSDIITDFDPDLPFVPCVPGEFNQVILNLIVNAAHAIADVVGDGSKGKGKITVTTRRAGGFADIRVADTGGGIPDKIREKIFDPFFTTKPVGKGTGQGLAIAHNVIVDKHKGSITVETEPGKGAMFIVRLPLDSGGGE
jgi:PAS domain S-box-containing protein